MKTYYSTIIALRSYIYMVSQKHVYTILTDVFIKENTYISINTYIINKAMFLFYSVINIQNDYLYH